MNLIIVECPRGQTTHARVGYQYGEIVVQFGTATNERFEVAETERMSVADNPELAGLFDSRTSTWNLDMLTCLLQPADQSSWIDEIMGNADETNLKLLGVSDLSWHYERTLNCYFSLQQMKQAGAIDESHITPVRRILHAIRAELLWRQAAWDLADIVHVSH